MQLDLRHVLSENMEEFSKVAAAEAQQQGLGQRAPVGAEAPLGQGGGSPGQQQRGQGGPQRGAAPSVHQQGGQQGAPAGSSSRATAGGGASQGTSSGGAYESLGSPQGLGQEGGVSGGMEGSPTAPMQRPKQAGRRRSERSPLSVGPSGGGAGPGEGQLPSGSTNGSHSASLGACWTLVMLTGMKTYMQD